MSPQHLLDNTGGFLYRRAGAPWKQQPRMYYITDARELARGATVMPPQGSQYPADDLRPILLGDVLVCSASSSCRDLRELSYADERSGRTHNVSTSPTASNAARMCKDPS